MSVDLHKIAQEVMQQFNFDEQLARGAQIGVRALYERLTQAADLALREAKAASESSSPANETAGAATPGTGS